MTPELPEALDNLPEEESNEAETGDSLPFEVKFPEYFDWGDMTFEVKTNKSLTSEQKDSIEKIFSEWAEKGVETGYGGFISSWEQEEKAWNKKDNAFKFWADMGSSDGKKALDSIFGSLAKTGLVERIKLS